MRRVILQLVRVYMEKAECVNAIEAHQAGIVELGTVC
jgi:hypothetical protein